MIWTFVQNFVDFKGSPCSQALYCRKSMEQYEGEFKGGKKHGKGIFIKGEHEIYNLLIEDNLKNKDKFMNEDNNLIKYGFVNTLDSDKVSI